MDPSESEDPSGYKFRLDIEALFSRDVTRLITSDDIISDDITNVHMPVIQFLIGGYASDLGKISDLLKTADPLVVVSTDLAEDSTLAGFISTFVKKWRKRQKDDDFDDYYYNLFETSKFLTQEMIRTPRQLEKTSRNLKKTSRTL